MACLTLEAQAKSAIVPNCQSSETQMQSTWLFQNSQRVKMSTSASTIPLKS